ncbi:GNAT family N-acetyltransferase [Actinoalloteichus caeruleus]|uniref:Acetyltransferase (GNAT) family protein n=2 Tax=Actinoalloteichus cyanogriseus TaxID=2893586 RepID=A0ABT1JGR7_ACTCY|nr:GNAT family N-acetyltransferase [Actinoalloteichus caeruleus]MCP2331366.1 Acetyltransferase (GNAT) family protein [Actinoalloteichus caeruleus DSM 43889]
MPTTSSTSTAALVAALQERTARALPAEHVVHLGGWWLRHSPGCAWWSAAVLAHEELAAEPLAERVGRAERFHAGYGGTARFQISPASPGQLDALLAGRGYRRESPMSLRTAPLDGARVGAVGAHLPVSVRDHADPTWFDTWFAVHGAGLDREAERRVLDRLDRPCGYASVALDGEVVSVGRVVLDDGWAGIFGMATRRHARGRGAARLVLGALAGWAGRRGAHQLYLQVDEDNTAAHGLYTRAGFTELAAYHYRTAP